MPQVAADTLVLTGVLIQKELGRQMTEEMHMDLKARLILNKPLQLNAECMVAFGPFAARPEEPWVLGRAQPRSEVPEIDVEQFCRLARQAVIKGSPFLTCSPGMTRWTVPSEARVL